MYFVENTLSVLGAILSIIGWIVLGFVTLLLVAGVVVGCIGGVEDIQKRSTQCKALGGFEYPSTPRKCVIKHPNGSITVI